MPGSSAGDDSTSASTGRGQAAGAWRQRLGHEARRHQPAQAVAQQHRGRPGAAQGIDDRAQVGAQAVGPGIAPRGPGLRPWPRWS
jgi:hypothetical protein